MQSRSEPSTRKSQSWDWMLLAAPNILCSDTGSHHLSSSIYIQSPTEHLWESSAPNNPVYRKAMWKVEEILQVVTMDLKVFICVTCFLASFRKTEGTFETNLPQSKDSLAPRQTVVPVPGLWTGVLYVGSTRSTRWPVSQVSPSVHVHHPPSPLPQPSPPDG